MYFSGNKSKYQRYSKSKLYIYLKVCIFSLFIFSSSCTYLTCIVTVSFTFTP